MINGYRKIISDNIPNGCKVIDIGCGEGELLSHLEERNISGHGLEIDPTKVSKAVANGLSVIQGDADNDLQYYADKGFDYAILALSLQIMKHPKDIMEQCLRIADKVIVVIPNFGHLRNRLYFTLKGQMPVTSSLSFQWYETPNIHFCTIKDFITFCESLNGTIDKRIALYKNDSSKEFASYGSLGANLFADYGIFIL